MHVKQLFRYLSPESVIMQCVLSGNLTPSSLTFYDRYLVKVDKDIDSLNLLS